MRWKAKAVVLSMSFLAFSIWWRFVHTPQVPDDTPTGRPGGEVPPPPASVEETEPEDGVGGGCLKARTRIRFATPEVARSAGIETQEVRAMESLSVTVEAYGRVAFDGSRTARISSRVGGILREVRCDLGADVASGEVLFVVDSIEFGEAQSDFLQAQAGADLARRNAEAERLLAERSATSRRELQTAEAQNEAAQAGLARARERLRNLGLADEGITRLEGTREVTTLLPVAAPFAGTVVERCGAVGERVEFGDPVMMLTDLSKVWVLVDLFERQIGAVRPGLEGVFVAEASPDRPFRGTVGWVSARVDPDTRTLPVRLEVENSGGVLRENLFGRATISVRRTPGALVVPKESVQWEGCHHVVFVETGAGMYQTRAVRLGFEGAGFHEVSEGLRGGERVVTTGSFLLKTEILKGSIGAG